MNMEKATFSARMENLRVGRPIYILKLLGVAALYALLAKVVLTLFAANGVVSIVWPPSGLALATLLVGGKRYFPGVFLGAFLANAMTGLALGVAAAIAMGNTLEAFLGAWLLTRDGRFDSNLRALGDYLRLVVLGGFVACGVAALNGSTTLLVSGFITYGAYFQNLLYWWMGDALGVVLITPLILAWRRIPDGWLEPKRTAEALLLLGLMFLANQIVFLEWFHDPVTNSMFEQVAQGYWMFLLVTWVAVRLGTGAVVIALVMTAIQALSGAALVIGFFAHDIAQTGLTTFWFYMMTLSVVGMALATYFTERKRMEDVLRKSEENLNRAQAIGQIGSWFLDIPANLLAWSAETHRMFGMPQRQTIDLKTFVAAIHPDDRDFVLKAWDEAMAGAPYDIEHRIVVDGQTRWVRERARIERDAKGHPLTGIGTVQDVTERKQIEAALSESEERYRALFEQNHEPIWLVDVQTGSFADFNTTAHKSLGYTREEFARLSVADLEATETPQEIALHIEKVLAEGSDVFETTHRTKRGELRHILASVNKVTSGGITYLQSTMRDITERKQAEATLQESEKLYRSLFENMLNGFAYCQMIFEQDQPQDFVYLNVNTAFEKLTGLKNVAGKRVSEVIPGIRQSDPKLFEIYGRVSLSGKPERFEIYVEALQQWFWISVYSPEKGYFVAVFDVITERKQAEEKLRASEQKFMRLFMEIPIPLGVADKDGVIAHFNNKFTEVFGYTVDDVPTLDEWWLKAYPDETYRRWVLDNWNDAVAKATKEGTNVESAEYRVTCKNGAERIVIIGGSPVDGGVLAIFNDITERKQTEETLRLKTEETNTFFSTALDLLCIANTDGYFLRLNPEWEKTLGYTLSDLQGKRFLDFVHPEDMDATLRAISELADQKTILNFTNRYYRKDGTYRWIEWHSKPVGKLIYAAARDITERKEYEEELKRSNAELEQFSYAVSHDMRQPLRMISSYLQLLELSLAGQLDNEKRGYFNFAIDGAKRIDQMLMALLEYSRIGRMGEPPALIDSRAVLDEALQFLQPAIAEAQAKVNVSGEWSRILISHDEILRLLQNLVGNAVKYRIAGRAPEIAVTGEVVKNEWRLCVADNGVGIIPDQIKRLFQIFQRLQSREAYEGTGIGLALCRKIAEHHKGRIWVESAGEGQGSKFYVVLPVSQTEDIVAIGGTA